MKTARLIVATLLLCSGAGCAKTPSAGPAQSAAAEPQPTGMTEAQPHTPETFAVAPPPGSRAAPVATVAAEGTERLYASALSYDQAVGYFDRRLPRQGCETVRRSSTKTSTVWVVQCRDGERAHVAVRDLGQVTSIAILEPLSD